MSEAISAEQLEKYAVRNMLYQYSKEELTDIINHKDVSEFMRAIVQELLDVEALTSSSEGYKRVVVAAGKEFPASEMFVPTNALRDAGFSCNEATAAKLWSRFSQDQCATWIQIDKESVERFVAWVSADLNADEAWS